MPGMPFHVCSELVLRVVLYEFATSSRAALL